MIVNKSVFCPSATCTKQIGWICKGCVVCVCVWGGGGGRAPGASGGIQPIENFGFEGALWCVIQLLFSVCW